MSEAKERWDEVGDRFNELTGRIKQRFDAQAAFTEDDRKKVNDALHQIRDALDAGFTALGDSLRDPSMRDEFKKAGSAIGEAVSSTFRDVADEVKKVVKRDQS